MNSRNKINRLPQLAVLHPLVVSSTEPFVLI
jgi:hypothetical protein